MGLVELVARKATLAQKHLDNAMTLRSQTINVQMFHLILDQFISRQNDDTFYFPLFTLLLCISRIHFAIP